MTIGELLVEINGDNSGLKKAMGESTNAVSTAVSKMVAGISLAAAAWKAVDLAIQGINYNKTAEQAEIAFGVFLGSAEAAKDMIEDLRDLARETPLEFDEVRDAAKRLSAFGVEADKIIPTMRTLADVSAGLQIPINDLAYLFGTIKTQGRAMTVDINQFANRGIPIWKELAKVIFDTTEPTEAMIAALRKMTEQGKIGFPEIDKAFQNMTSKGGDFFEMAIKQMDSLAGSQSNLNDSFESWLGFVTKGTTGPLKDMNNSLATILEWDKTALDDWTKLNEPINKWAATLYGIKNTQLEIKENLAVQSETWRQMTVRGKAYLAEQNKGEEAAKKAAAERKAQEEAFGKVFSEYSKDFDAFQAKAKRDNLSQEDTLKKQIDLRNKYKDVLFDQLSEGAISEKQYGAEVARINSLNNANLATLGKIKEEDSAITMGKKLMSDAQDEINEKTLEQLKYEDDWFTSDELILSLREQMADETNIITKETMDALNATEDWFKENLKVEDVLGDISKNMGLASKMFVSLASSARKFNNGPLADLLDGMAEAAKHGEEFADNLGQLVASGGKDIGAWLGTITSGISLIADAWAALFGMQDDGEAERKKADEERLAAIREIEAEYASHFVNELDRLEQERAERVAYARSIGADVLNIERYYAGEIAKVRTKSSGTQIEEATIAAESKAIKDRFEAIIGPYQNLINILTPVREALREILGQDYTIPVLDEALAAVAEYGVQLSAELEGVESRLILFQERYSEAFDGIANTLTDALTNSSSEADFTQSIMEMLRKMAIDAAIVAGGFAEKFKEIGVMIAEALRDGFQEGEVTSIKAAISQLYTDATASIADINSLFPGFANGTNFAPGGLALVGEQGPELMNVPRGSQIIPNEQTQALLQGAGTTYSKGDTNITIQSNAPLDPLETARQIQFVQESLAFAGAF